MLVTEQVPVRWVNPYYLRDDDETTQRICGTFIADIAPAFAGAVSCLER